MADDGGTRAADRHPRNAIRLTADAERKKGETVGKIPNYTRREKHPASVLIKVTTAGWTSYPACDVIVV